MHHKVCHHLVAQSMPNPRHLILKSWCAPQSAVFSSSMFACLEEKGPRSKLCTKENMKLCECKETKMQLVCKGNMKQLACKREDYISKWSSATGDVALISPWPRMKLKMTLGGLTCHTHTLSTIVVGRPKSRCNADTPENEDP